MGEGKNKKITLKITLYPEMTRKFEISLFLNVESNLNKVSKAYVILITGKY